MQSNNPVSLIVFAAVASDDRELPSHFIKTELKINTADYLKTLNGVLLSLISRRNDATKVILIQNSTPLHLAKHYRIT